MECVELAPAVGCVARFESGSKLHALHTLRAVWFRLCRPGDRRALPSLEGSWSQCMLENVEAAQEARVWSLACGPSLELGSWSLVVLANGLSGGRIGVSRSRRLI